MARIGFRRVLGVVLGGCVVAFAAEAQFGFYSLPQNDFTWTWGDIERRMGFVDIEASGTDPPFRCEVTASLRTSSRLSTSDVREIENSLQGSIQFVRDTVEILNALDLQNELSWAQLSCAKPQAREATEEERAEREAKARERMQREVERRRARQQRANQ